MFETAFFTLAFVHNILLIWKYSGAFRNKFVEINPIYYEFTIIPAFIFVLAGLLFRIDPGEQITILLLIAFVLINIFYDHVWRVENLRELKYRLPYIAIYYPLNVGLVYFTVQWNMLLGILILLITLVQLGVNSMHSKKKYLSLTS